MTKFFKKFLTYFLFINTKICNGSVLSFAQCKILAQYLIINPISSIATKVDCFCYLLKCFSSFWQSGPWSVCSCRSRLIWVHIVCPHSYISQTMLEKKQQTTFKHMAFMMIFCTCYKANSYKPSILIVVHRQTVQTQIRHYAASYQGLHCLLTECSKFE